jgi:hypothetical protein
MTLVARTVAADSRRFSQRPVILDGMIVSPSWTDQSGNLPLPDVPNSGGLIIAFAKAADTDPFAAYSQHTNLSKIAGNARQIAPAILVQIG